MEEVSLRVKKCKFNYKKYINESQEKYLMCSIVGLMTLLLTFWFYDLWNYDFNVPLFYGPGDGMFLQRLVKGIHDNGTIYTNRLLGAPFVAEFYDFPMYADSLHLTILNLLSHWFNNTAIAFNIYYIFLFPMTAIISYLVMNSLKVKNILGILGSIVFTFSPYRFYRGTSHYFLSAYTLIPVGVLILIWLVVDKDFFVFNKKFWRYKRNYIAIGTLILTAISGIYYVFFLCFFMVIIIIVKILNDAEKKKTLFQGIILLFIPCATIVISALPNLYNKYIFGGSSESPVRSFVESEIYGLKISELFMPIQSHGINKLESLIQTYNASSVLINENRMSYLGIIGILGFIVLMFYLMYNLRDNSMNNYILHTLSKLTLVAILMGTIGGIGSIFAILISPQIRAYNRISIYILYFCILGFCIFINKIIEKTINNKKIIMMCCITIFSVSTLEQVTFVKDQSFYINNYYSHKNFVEKIEDTVGSGGMIFQLPYQAFPEVPPINNMADYMQSIAYLHSDTLKWSYGDYKGRQGDLWVRETSSLPTDKMIEKISFAGFDGIYINTLGYTSEELQLLQEEIKMILEVEPIYSSNNELVFYSLQTYNQQNRDKYSEEEWNDKKLEATQLQYTWGDGFYELEGIGDENWRWCDKEGTLLIYNNTDEVKEISLSFKVFTNYQEASNFLIENDNVVNEYKINVEGSQIDLKIKLKQGQNKIKFSTDAKKVEAPGDTRSMYFRISDFNF